MILDNIDFTDFFKHIEGIFCNHFSKRETEVIMEHIDILSDANFRCYKANMLVIKSRKINENNYKLISDMEWVARSVGEYRVSSKARINLYISRIRAEGMTTDHATWITDDVVYSIGEMMDRLSIETIKREDFFKNGRSYRMRAASQELTDRVEKYLKEKLKEIDKKGFYECIQEQRTYDLEGIVEELAI